MARCKMIGSSAGVDSTAICTGSCSNPSASFCTPASKVAENNRFCRCAGSSFSTAASSSAKPRSSNRSASSSTRVLIAPSLSALWFTRSNKRPGVATTTSAPPRKPIICGLMDTPPNTTATLSGAGRCWAKLRSTSPTWAASSRVGTSTRARTRRGALGGWPCRACSSGKAKAPVLPEPVWAWACTSLPRRMAGMACTCTGVGMVHPSSAAARKSAGERPMVWPNCVNDMGGSVTALGGRFGSAKIHGLVGGSQLGWHSAPRLSPATA